MTRRGRGSWRRTRNVKRRKESKGIRAFIAIEIPDAAKDLLAALSGRLRVPGVKASWVKPENMHLTLRFLGDVEPDRLETLADILEIAYQNREPFDLRIRGTGAFPNMRADIPRSTP